MAGCNHISGRLLKTDNRMLQWAFELIVCHEHGVLQSDLKRMLGVDSRKCSRIAMDLEKRGLISRKPVAAHGRMTYLLKRSKRCVIYASQIDSLLTGTFLSYLLKGAARRSRVALRKR